MEKKTVCRVVSPVLGALILALPIAVQAQSWTRVWSDEFSGSGAASGGNWTYDTGGGGFGNNELQCYQTGSANAKQTGGILTIQARRQSVGRPRLHLGAPQDAGHPQLRSRRASGEGLGAHAGPDGTGPLAGVLDAGHQHQQRAVAGLRRDRHHGAHQHQGNILGIIHWNGPAGYAYYTAASPASTSRLCTTTRIDWNATPDPVEGLNGAAAVRRTSRETSTARKSSIARSSSS